MSLAEFHDEVRLALTSYYEGIVNMEGASGVALKLAYKRPIQRIKDIGREPPAPPAAEDDAAAGGRGSSAAAPAEADVQLEAESEPPPACLSLSLPAASACLPVSLADAPLPV